MLLRQYSYGFILCFLVSLGLAQTIINWTGASDSAWGNRDNWHCSGALCTVAPIPPDTSSQTYAIGFPQCASNVEMVISGSALWPQIALLPGTCPKIALDGALTLSTIGSSSFFSAHIRFVGTSFSSVRVLDGSLNLHNLTVPETGGVMAPTIDIGIIGSGSASTVTFDLSDSADAKFGTIEAKTTKTQVITFRTENKPTVPFASLTMRQPMFYDGSALLRINAYTHKFEIREVISIDGPITFENTAGTTTFNGGITIVGDHVVNMFSNIVINGGMNSTTTDSVLKFYGSLHFGSTSSVVAINIKPSDTIPDVANTLIVDAKFQNSTLEWLNNKLLTIRQTNSNARATFQAMKLNKVLFDSVDVQIDDLSLPTNEALTMRDSSITVTLPDTMKSLKLDMTESTVTIHADTRNAKIESVTINKTAIISLKEGFYTLPEDLGTPDNRAPAFIQISNGTLYRSNNTVAVSSLSLRAGGILKFKIHELTQNTLSMSALYDTDLITFSDGSVIDIEFTNPNAVTEPTEPINVLLIRTASQAPRNLPMLKTNLNTNTNIRVTTTLERPPEGGVYFKIQMAVAPTTQPPTTQPPTTLPPVPTAPVDNTTTPGNRTASGITCGDCNDSELSSGALAGIILFVLIVLAAVAVLALLYFWRRRSIMREEAG